MKAEEEAALQGRFFDRRKNQYRQTLINNPPLHTRRELDVLLRTLEHLPPGARVADFGAGSGRLTIPLLQRGFHVCAIDVSRASLEALADLGSSLGLTGLELAAELPLGEKFEAVTGSDVLHHVPMPETLPLIRAALADGGIAAFSEPGAYNASWYIYLPIASSWHVEKGLLNCTYGNLTNVFRKSGFSGIAVTGLGLLPRAIFNMTPRLCELNDRAGNSPVLKYLAYRYVIEARA